MILIVFLQTIVYKNSILMKMIAQHAAKLSAGKFLRHFGIFKYIHADQIKFGWVRFKEIPRVALCNAHFIFQPRRSVFFIEADDLWIEFYGSAIDRDLHFTFQHQRYAPHAQTQDEAGFDL